MWSKNKCKNKTESPKTENRELIQEISDKQAWLKFLKTLQQKTDMEFGKQHVLRKKKLQNVLTADVLKFVLQSYFLVNLIQTVVKVISYIRGFNR